MEQFILGLEREQDQHEPVDELLEEVEPFEDLEDDELFEEAEPVEEVADEELFEEDVRAKLT